MFLKNTVSWDVRPYSLADIYRSFGGTFCVQIQIYSVLLNDGKFILDYKPSYPRKQDTKKKKSFGHLLRLRDYSKDFNKIW